ncbi:MULTISPECIES: head GIN domain-containing protein [unclassified Treponema]|uniref:head GIN domain-containing protein n=1 Tax=unclassified Treponema TaxID=2638727 RepID=UPI0020A613BE|nr:MULTISPECIES: head GIN domain-containing protein [unclassified Treponema]UTC44583.1 DUF2807 domain-containing protein [Treponema sp. OMZ 857]UTC50986.1 DUF2807 domain-containing protein [Treponema sp. OMZ 855]
MNKIKISIVCIALTALLLFTASSCFIVVNGRVRGNGTLKTESFSRSNFDSVSISGDWMVDIRQSETFSVTIDADENLFNYLYVDVSNNILHIGFQHGYVIGCSNCKAIITMPVLIQLTASGSLTGTVSSFNIPGRTMSVVVSGSGDVVARDITVKKLKLNISGSGSFGATGKAQSLEGSISGSGNIKTTRLETEDADISISGSGSAKVWVTTFLRADISGSGSVGYKGNPLMIDRRISGSGSIYPL